MTDYYTKNETNLMHDKMHIKLDDIKKDTKEALAYIKDTNGRVGQVEKKQYGAMIGLAVVVIVLLPMLAWALNTLVNVKQDNLKEIRTAIADELRDMEFEGYLID